MYDRVSVRMYHVGFGDCFLVRFWRGEEPFTVLFDCGSITEGARQVTLVAEDVITTCSAAGKPPRIDLLVATHRHKDHVGGFANPAWSKVTVGEVWMPWTEDPKDPAATRIRTRQSSLALALASSATDEEPLVGDEPPRTRRAQAALSARAMAVNALTNEAAMTTVHTGFLGKPPRHFLPEKDTQFQERKLAAAPDLSFHILGPSRSEAVIAKMDPPNGKGYLAPPGPDGQSGRVPAFSRWQIPATQFDLEARPDSFRGDDRKAIEESAELPVGSLAAALDDAVNNTSLIVMIECGDLMMLFPGDAQWGSWNAILEDSNGRALLARTSFYKVGHHGSHNATPREFIDSIMPAGGVALFSTCTMKVWPNIPRGPLVDAIAGKVAKWARSDEEAKARTDGFAVQTGLYVEWETPLPLKP